MKRNPEEGGEKESTNSMSTISRDKNGVPFA